MLHRGNKNKKRRSLRLTVFMVMCFSLALFIVLFLSIFHVTVQNVLESTETSYISEQLSVIRGLIDSAGQNTRSMAVDVAFWEETIEFTLGNNPDYIKRHWNDISLLQAYNLNFIVIKDVYGNEIYSEFHDYLRGTPLSVPEGFADNLAEYERTALERYGELYARRSAANEYCGDGVIFFGGASYYICSIPVALPESGLKPSGVLTIGLSLTNELLQSVTHMSGVNFSVKRDLQALRMGEPKIARDDGNMVAYMPLDSLDSCGALLEMTTARTVFENSSRMMQVNMVLMVAAVAVFAAALYLMVVRRVLSPIESISTEIGQITGGHELSAGKYDRNEEFHTLSTAINDMLARLESSALMAERSRISINAFKGILEGMDAYLYVSDLDTDEILFINSKMVTHFGLDGDVTGKLCWQQLQSGKSGRCEFCPIHKLEKNTEDAVVWEEHNTVTGRYYRNTDRIIEWMGGRKAHLQHSVDITNDKLAEQSLQRRLKQQELMSVISRRFIETADMHGFTSDALRMAGEFMAADRVMLARWDRENGCLILEQKWYNPKNEWAKIEMDSVPFNENMAGFHGLVVEQRDYVSCSDTLEHDEYKYVGRDNIRAFVFMPVKVKGELWGVLSIHECTNPHDWTESDIYLAQLIANTIAGTIVRSAAEKDLMRMSAIVNTSPSYITYFDTNGRIEYLNGSAEVMTGYTADELMTGGLPLLIGEQACRLMLGHLIPHVIQNGQHDFILPITRKDGEVRTLSFCAFVAVADPIGIAAIASDITDKLRMERELVAAKEHAEQSSRAKSDFLSRMSHEMRTPMNAIIGMTGIGRMSGDIEKKDYCLDKVDEASKHLLGVINDILDMSKIESGKFELSFGEFNFENMLIRVTNVVNFRIDEKDQSFIVNIDPRIPRTLISDEQRLAQVITNLLSNAIKFTPERGTITLTADLIGEQDGVCELRVEVKDTGIGISPEQQSRLFRSFEQADGGISRRFGGTGLGLAISKSIIDMMDGEIWIESEEGAGSKFIFTMKATRGEQACCALLGPDVNWGNLRVLVVDDSPQVLEYFLSLSSASNFYCEAAASGYQAIEKIENSRDDPFDIIFVDWRMPCMNGIELTRRIKGGHAHGSVVIMISAAEWSDVESEARSAGVDLFLSKPLFASLIVDCINECMGMSQLSSESSIPADHTGVFSGERILLAEDIEINREIVAALLEDTGVRIDCAQNGAEAVAMFERDPEYGMIFMDIHMPEMDGFEATRRIRALSTRNAADVPIVAMTANVFREDVEKCLAAGMNDHIGKPVDAEEMFLKMKKYLKR